MLDSKDTTQLDTGAFKEKIDEIRSDAEMKDSDLSRIQQLGQGLVQNAKTGDVSSVKDKMAESQRNWREFGELLSERVKEAAFRDEQASRYEEVRDNVLLWLGGIEAKVDGLESVAIELEVIEAQVEELRVSVLIF